MRRRGTRRRSLRCWPARWSLDAYADCAKSCIQLLGGMGFTWEHDAHLHLRRSISMRQLCGGSSVLRARQAARQRSAGGRRVLDFELPPDGGGRARRDPRAVVAKVKETEDPAERRTQLIEHGLIAPHWPPPYGRDAGPSSSW